MSSCLSLEGGMAPRQYHFNQAEVRGSYALIFLTGSKGGVATIDKTDLEKAMEFGPWYLSTVGTVVCKIPKTNGLKRQLNRLVTNAEPADIVQHIDEDKTNCRKKNLLTIHTGHVARGTNLGVYFETARQKWRASIMEDGRRKTIGRFDTLEEASAARAEAELEVGKTRGIYYQQDAKKWRAYYKSSYLGLFKTFEKAVLAQRAAEFSPK